MSNTQPKRISRNLVLTVLFFVAVLAVFVFGAQRQARRLGVLGPAHAEIRARATERSRQVEAWHPGRASEREAWEQIAARFSDALPADHPRLRASGEITSLAEACGLRDVALVEVREQQAPGLDPWEDEWEAGEQAEVEDGLWDGIVEDPEGARVGRYEYEMRFWAEHRGLLAFLGRLGREDVLIEAESIRLRREPPGVRVEMLLAAYGREG
ncbi:MAG: hypothetical protein GF330_00660 [Candidatus Eisenbacteria bacterium]|nr:hypothetical protein [Candidatus Eisenbacteria bacterium]